MDDKLLNSNLNYENYDDYIEKIQFLLNNKSYAKVMSDNEKKLAYEIYDYDKSLEIFVKKVTDMAFKE